MHRLFGKPKVKEPAPTLEDASGSITKRTGALDEKIKGLDAELKVFKDQMAKAKGPSKEHIKRRAMETLKRKRMYENQRDQLAAQSFNIEQTSFAIQTVKDTQITVAAMKDASKQLKFENKKIDLNDIENMQDDLEDLLEDAGEIGDILGRSYGCDAIEDEDLEAEFAGLEDEFESEGVEESPVYLRSPSSLPVQPNSALPGGVAARGRAEEVDEYGLPVMNA